MASTVTGVSITMNQEQADQGKEKAHTIVMTSAIQNCQLELIADAAFTGGILTQDSASAAVAQCEVAAGTTLSVRVHSNSRDFTITATSPSAPNFTVVSDTTTGGAAQVIEKGV